MGISAGLGLQDVPLLTKMEEPYRNVKSPLPLVPSDWSMVELGTCLFIKTTRGSVFSILIVLPQSRF